jgi:rhodanese-related sulfurtransferase
MFSAGCSGLEILEQPVPLLVRLPNASTLAMTEVPLEIDCQTVHARLLSKQDLLLLDCREPDEHAIVNVAGAQLLPMSQLAARLAELEPYRDREIVVHCHHGGRSLKVAHWLRGQGYVKVQSMAGGIDRWAQEIDRSLPRY